MGCGNGMEEKINCSWLPSDVDMINATFPLYKDNTPFVTYYVTVSGHLLMHIIQRVIRLP